ncbi:MAG: GAF domain-containing protein [Nitrospirota bacterium]
MNKSNGNGPDRREYLPLIVLIAVFALSAALLVAQYFYNKESLNAEFSRENILTARYAATELADFLERERVSIENLAGFVALTGDIGKGRPALELWMKTHRRSPRLFSFFVLDGKGRYMYSVPGSLVDRYMQDLSGEDYFQNIIRNRDFYSTGARSDGKGTWQITLAAPIVQSADGKGKLLGVIVESVDVKALDRMFIGGINTKGEAYAFLIDESGRMLARQKSGKLYQVEGSSDTLRRMLKGEEGSAPAVSAYSGQPGLMVFSPVRFDGRIWSLGIMVPSAQVYGEATKNLTRTFIIISIMTLAFSWSLISVARTSRYKAAMRERKRMSDHLLHRNRELSALNDLSVALSGNEDLDGLLKKALDVITLDMGARGGAVRLFSPPSGDLALKYGSGMPEGFGGLKVCNDFRSCFCQKVLGEGKPAVIRAADGSVPGKMPCGDFQGEGLALIPLVVKKKPLGVLYLWGLKEERSDEREELLLALGNQMAAGIENVLQMEDTKRHAARASALFHTAQALTRSLDLDDLLNIIMRETASLLKAKRCMLMLYSEEANRVDCRVALGFQDSPAGKLSFDLSGIFWEAMTDGAVKVVDINEKGEDVPWRLTKELGLERFVLVPLISKGKVLGFILLEMAGKSPGMLEDLKLLVGFSNQAAVAIETSSFYIRTIEKYNENLQRLSNRIIETQEEERKRISRDLHDELGQSLTAIKINLDMVKDGLPQGMEHLKTKIGDAIDLVVQTLDSVRRLSFELRPSMLDDFGLSMVLGKLVSDFKKRSGIEVEFIEEGPEGRLLPQVEVVLYRVVQEALTNVLKHARATRVAVSLRKDPEKGMVSLLIEDNGTGFSITPDGHAKDSKGFGLMGIKERVSLLGGNFRILTEEDRGTRLLIDIPLAKGEEMSWKEA